MTRIMTILVATSTLAVAACGDRGAGDGFYREAGAFLDEGGFGNPTMINMMAQVCNPGGSGGGFKSGAVTDPKVVMDPSSTPQRPVYRVHCSGNLNGKFARVVFDEYVASGTELPPSDDGGLAAIEGAAE